MAAFLILTAVMILGAWALDAMTGIFTGTRETVHPSQVRHCIHRECGPGRCDGQNRSWQDYCDGQAR